MAQKFLKSKVYKKLSDFKAIENKTDFIWCICIQK